MKTILLGIFFIAAAASASAQGTTTQATTPVGSVPGSQGWSATTPVAPSNCHGALFDNRVPRSIVIIQSVPGPGIVTRPNGGSSAHRTRVPHGGVPAPSTEPSAAANPGSISGIGRIGSGVTGLASSGVGRIESSGVGSIGVRGIGGIGMPSAPASPSGGRNMTAPPIAIAPPLATAPPLFATVCY